MDDNEPTGELRPLAGLHCQICGKPAIYHIAEVIAETRESRSLHFCVEHAAEYLANPDSSPPR